MALSPQDIRDPASRRSSATATTRPRSTPSSRWSSALETAQHAGHGDGGAGPGGGGQAAGAVSGASVRRRGVGAGRRRSTVPVATSTRPRRSAARCCSPSAPPTRPSPRPNVEADGCSAGSRRRQLLDTRAERESSRRPRSSRARPASRSGCRSRARCRRCSPDATSCESDVDAPRAVPRGPARADHRGGGRRSSDLTQRVPDGLADMRRPLLSALRPRRRAGRRRTEPRRLRRAGRRRRRRHRRHRRGRRSSTRSPPPTTWSRRRASHRRP